MPQVGAASPSARDRSACFGGHQDLLHLLALGQLFDELIQITDLAHQRLLHFLDLHPANGAADQLPRRVERGRLGEESREILSLSGYTLAKLVE